MKITEDDITKYQEIWRKEFREEISAEDARKTIARVDELYLLLYRPNRRTPHSEPRENTNDK